MILVHGGAWMAGKPRDALVILEKASRDFERLGQRGFEAEVWRPAKVVDVALNGAAAHAFAHILYKALLFMGAGAVLQARASSRDFR